MSRLLFLLLVLGGLVAVSAIPSAPARAPAPARPMTDEPAHPPAPPLEPLLKTIKFGGYDGEAPLQDALDQLDKIYNLRFTINEQAFRNEGLKPDQVYRINLCQDGELKPMDGTIFQVLQTILSRVPVESGATLMVRPNCIEITTRKAQIAEVFPDRAVGKSEKKTEAPRSFEPPLVSVHLNEHTLLDAIWQMRRQCNVSFLLDPSLKGKQNTTLSLTLLNVPVDTAVTMITEVADLDYVWLDNAIFLTSKEKAEKLRKKWPTRHSGGRVPVMPARTPRISVKSVATIVDGQHTGSRPTFLCLDPPGENPCLGYCSRRLCLAGLSPLPSSSRRRRSEKAPMRRRRPLRLWSRLFPRPRRFRHC
jgi:hypothetical protein